MTMDHTPASSSLTNETDRPRGRTQSILLVTILALLGVVAVGEVGARTVEDELPAEVTWYDASTQLKVSQMAAIGDVDVVFAGTSMAWQGLVPAAFTDNDAEARSAWNAGLAGGVPGVMSPWLLDHVVPTLEPDTVVWGLSSLDFAPAYGDENIEAWDRARSSDRRLLASIDRSISKRSVLIDRRRALRTPGWWFSETTDDEADIATASSVLGPRGERLDFEPDVSDERGAVMAARLRGFGVSVDDYQTVEAVVNQLTARGVEVVLVELPVPDRFITTHPAGGVDHEQVGLRIGALGDQLGVQHFDLSRGFADDDFVDFTHLDADAAEILTRRLAALINGRPDPGGEADPDAPVEGETVTSVDGDCELEEIVDEYGFVIEVCVEG